MADSRGRTPDALAGSRHTRIEPIRGNARRRTIVLLAATGVTVLGVRLAVAGDPPGTAGTPSAGGSSQSRQESAQAAKTGSVPTFYVSADGNDQADGTTPDRPWRTLARADQHQYLPGERLLLRGGDVFTGSLELKAGEAGRADEPVAIGSYGTGPASIKPGPATPGISVYDTAGVAVSGLTLVGAGPLASTTAGVSVYNDLPGDQVLDGITVSGVDVSGFRDGVAVVGGNGDSGFAHVKVSDSRLHGNRNNGLVSDGPPVAQQTKGHRPFHDFQVSGVEAYDNAGDPANHKVSTGSGIDLGGVVGGVIENSTAHGNGGACDSSNGPVGIWIHDAADFTIRHNVSYSNRTAGLTDGGGFDIDQNTENSVLEANLTYDNWGPGYMVYSGSADVASTGNTVRYNVSIDDARGPKNADSITYGALMLAGYETGLTVHHNTVSQSSKAEKATLLNLGGHLLIGLQLKNTTIRDNVFAAGSGALLDAGVAPTTKQVLMQGNDYYSASGHWKMRWGSQAYTSLATWRKATGQEQVAGHADGLDADPGLAPAAAAPWDPTHKQVPVPKAGGPAAAAGLDLAGLFGTDLGTQDYFGRPVAGSKMLGAVAG